MPFVSQTQLRDLGWVARGKMLANTRQLGLHPQTHDPFLISQLDRCAGTYIIGKQGGGKSGEVINLAMADLLGNESMFFIDPHGDAVDELMAQLPDVLPRERLDKIYLLDMADEQYPFGLNVFSGINYNSGMAFAESIERIEHIFHILWPEVMNQHFLPRYFRGAIIALAANQGSTLVDMYTFLTTDGFRHRILQNVHDQSVKQFWQMQYDDLSPSQRYQRVEPLVGRLESLFMGHSLVRNILGQQTTINYRRSIENREVFLIKLPLTTIPQDARLIGTIFLSQLTAAIFSFNDTPEQYRPGVSLFVDEFAYFATPDFSKLFREGRKFGAKVTIAHQDRSQLPPALQAATMTARNIICFQSIPDDAREMGHVFLGGETIVKPEDIDPKPVDHLMHHGSDNFNVRTFVYWYVLQLQAQRHSGEVEIRRPGVRWGNWPFWLLSVPEPTDNPKVDDPTPYLNHLLYHVEKTGEAGIHIPSQIVYGFSNIGRGFYSVFNRPFKGRWLSPDIRYPAHLVVDAGHGLEWTRPPETSKEQLYHFIFHLRQTLEYLAAHPIGKKSVQSPSDVAQEIVALPKRHAFVRSGSDVGRIITDDMLPRMDEDTALGNYVLIKLQTRQKYCTQINPDDPHPSASLPPKLPPSVPPQPSVPRWEEI